MDPDELINAVKTGDLSKVQEVFAKGTTDINYQRPKDGKTALHMAYGFKNLEIIRFLIDHGADIKIEDDDGDTPVIYILSLQPIDINILEYTITIPTLDPKDGKDIAYILNKQLPVNKYKRLGMGSYGLVVSPSFKTMNNTKVTKFMFDEDTYDESLKASRNIKRNLPLLNILSEEYPEVYTYSNVATNNAQVGKILKALNPSIQNTNRVYPILMENLGVSFDKLQNSDVPGLGRIPIQTILEQYLKLADTIIEMQRKGYIHGDIRETNVVINLQTGKITIIDFDWLMPVYQFKRMYTSTFYSHPPELMFSMHKNPKSVTDTTFYNTALTVQQYRTFVNEQIQKNISKYDGDRIHTITDIENGIHKTMNIIAKITPSRPNDNVIGDIHKRYEHAMNLSYMEIDSYGLGYSLVLLHELLEQTEHFRSPEDMPILMRLKGYANALCNPSKRDRMTIVVFREKMKEELDKFATTSMPGGMRIKLRRKGTKKVTKRKHRKTRRHRK